MDDQTTLSASQRLIGAENIGAQSSHIKSLGLKETTNINPKAGENTDHVIGQLRARKTTGLGLKPKPLNLSTNIIHNRPLKTPQPSSSSSISAKPKTTKTPAKNEDQVSASVENAYDPLKDVYMFDEELFKVVCKLDIADDGLPDYKFDEPFDF